jgi:hypothetical protein
MNPWLILLLIVVAVGLAVGLWFGGVALSNEMTRLRDQASLVTTQKNDIARQKRENEAQRATITELTEEYNTVLDQFQTAIKDQTIAVLHIGSRAERYPLTVQHRTVNNMQETVSVLPLWPDDYACSDKPAGAAACMPHLLRPDGVAATSFLVRGMVDSLGRIRFHSIGIDFFDGNPQHGGVEQYTYLDDAGTPGRAGAATSLPAAFFNGVAWLGDGDVYGRLDVSEAGSFVVAFGPDTTSVQNENWPSDWPIRKRFPDVLATDPKV